MTTTTSVLLTVGALLVGALAGYLLATLRSALRTRDLEVRAASAEARLEDARTTALHQLEAQRRQTEEQVATIERQAADRIALAQRGADARVAAAEADQARLTEQFQGVANKVLSASSEQFLALATQRLGRASSEGAATLKAREEAVAALVGPLAESLEKMRAQVDEAERQRLTGTLDLKHQVVEMRQEAERLRGETSQLVTALRSSQVRGTWGELQLRRVVEAAGMLAHVDFVEQDQVRTDDGALRPDMVVRLAGGKNVVVDAKVAFLGFLDAQQATDEKVRSERLAAHARHVRKHVDDLAGKEYWEQFSPAPEFVVMFVPAESFLSAALEQDPALLEYAVSRNVVLATPMTLVAMLRTVAYAWRQEALAANAQQVLTLGKELHGRLAVMGSHLAKLGRQLGSAADAYNATVGSLESRVLVSARRFSDLGVVDAALDGPPPVNPRLSVVSAPELLAAANDDLVALDEHDRADLRTDPGPGERAQDIG